MTGSGTFPDLSDQPAYADALRVAGLDTRARDRLRRPPAPSGETPAVTVRPEDGTLLDVVPLPGTGKVVLIVAHVVPDPSAPAAPGTAEPAAVERDAGDRHGPATVAPAPASRTGPSATPNGLRVDPPSRRVWVEGREVGLTFQEFELLGHLTAHPWTVFSRRQLLQTLWPTSDANTRTVDVHVHRLRRKLGRWGAQLTTVRRVGYVYRPNLAHRTEHPAATG